ncbi:MAG: GNAT family N-acetyltransferase [Erysipelotrichaceae bacterium]|nr:GNAT family N-acetyltransferase [Erysipelotrichaceae bacterium]
MIIKKMETVEEIKGKAYVHWKSWHEAYAGIIDREYLDKLSLERCEKMAFSQADQIIIAKENGSVIGFIGYGSSKEETPEAGVIFALYVLAEYYGRGVGRKLMDAGLKQIERFPRVRLWVLKENERAIRFYEKCGFVRDGMEKTDPHVAAAEIRMTLDRE